MNQKVAVATRLSTCFQHLLQGCLSKFFGKNLLATKYEIDEYKSKQKFQDLCVVFLNHIHQDLGKRSNKLSLSP